MDEFLTSGGTTNLGSFGGGMKLCLSPNLMRRCSGWGKSAPSSQQLDIWWTHLPAHYTYRVLLPGWRLWGLSTLERVRFYSCCQCMLSHFSHVQLFVTLWTVAHQAPLSVGFPRQEYWSGLPFPSPRDRLDPGIKPMSPWSFALQADSSLLSHRGSPSLIQT